MESYRQRHVISGILLQSAHVCEDAQSPALRLSALKVLVTIPAPSAEEILLIL